MCLFIQIPMTSQYVFIYSDSDRQSMCLFIQILMTSQYVFIYTDSDQTDTDCDENSDALQCARIAGSVCVDGTCRCPCGHSFIGARMTSALPGTRSRTADRRIDPAICIKGNFPIL